MAHSNGRIHRRTLSRITSHPLQLYAYHRDSLTISKRSLHISLVSHHSAILPFPVLHRATLLCISASSRAVSPCFHISHRTHTHTSAQNARARAYKHSETRSISSIAFCPTSPRARARSLVFILLCGNTRAKKREGGQRRGLLYMV